MFTPGLRLNGGGRVLVVAIVSIAATVAVVVVWRVPLAVGLIGLTLACFGLLPRTSRRYLARRLVRTTASIAMAMAVVWILIYHLPSSPPLDFAGSTGFPSLSGGPDRQPPDGFKPIEALQAYVAWLADIPTGDLGDTQYSETVTEGIGRTIPISMQLVLYSQIIAAVIAVPGGLLGARMRGRKSDVGFRAGSLLGLSVPVYVTGMLLVYFFAVGKLDIFGLEIGFRVLPSGRYSPLGDGLAAHFKSMALPSISLGVSTAAIYLVVLRSELVQQLTLPHIELARSKGVSDRKIIRTHALRSAAPPVVAAVAAHSAAVLGNVIIIERIFLLPGFGDYVIIAIIREDIPAIVGALFVTTCILAVVNLFAEALLLTLDPRIAA